ncbi:MAG: YdiU family protein [Gammaproteobacteria bacterium]|nr:YdiU family protein [Gammaproteobacteria bacterium]
MSFPALTFNNRFINNLPSDPEQSNGRRQVHHAAYSFVDPTMVSNPTLVAVTDELAQLIGFTAEDSDNDDFVALFSGNKLLDGMQPYAMCYGGHQFGNWAGQLGDGRAINLGEVVTPSNGQLILQLKGAGPTPYSRTADGLAVLRSSVREFLCSEAMFNLGIATTRALSLCLTGESVERDMFYDGNGKGEPGAVVCRVSRSFTRFGSFQLPASRGDLTLLKQLIDHTITSDFPHLGEPSKAVYLQWFSEVCDLTCAMIVDWMRVGFVHGVMNTDNMSIIGETIDYGPYGWLDNFDPNWTPNTTDFANRRYKFGAQGQVSQWNLFQLANAIYPLIEEAEPLQQRLNDYAQQYEQQWAEMMSKKLGLKQCNSKIDIELFSELERILTITVMDMTIFYRQLAKLPLELAQCDNNRWLELFECCYYQLDSLHPLHQQEMSQWLNNYITRALTDDISATDRTAAMNAVNPKYVLRNYLAQQAIELAEQGDFSEVHQLQQLLLRPYDEQPDFERYAQKRPEWARNKAGCSTLSCSS